MEEGGKMEVKRKGNRRERKNERSIRHAYVFSEGRDGGEGGGGGNGSRGEALANLGILEEVRNRRSKKEGVKEK